MTDGARSAAAAAGGAATTPAATTPAAATPAGATPAVTASDGRTDDSGNAAEEYYTDDGATPAAANGTATDGAAAPAFRITSTAALQGNNGPISANVTGQVRRA